MSNSRRQGLAAGLMLAAGAAGFASDRAAAAVPAAVGPVAVPVASVGSTNGSSAQGPRIQFEAKTFDFGKVVSGQPVKHVYYFTNFGDQDLILSNVQPGCGCTSAGDWTRVVKPGEAGKIPIQFNSANYNSPVTKLVTVTCNDKTQPSIPLQLKGTVWKPIEFTPQYAGLNLKPDAPFSTVTVRITNALDESVWLFPPQSSNPAFGAELRTNSPGKEYLVVISNTMVLPQGSTRGDITLATSASNLCPAIKISTWATVFPVITVTPSQVSVPRAPLPTNYTASVTIMNNSTNPIAISDASVNATNVQASVKELQAGHYYTVNLKFDPGFQMPGYPLAFSAKTSNPQMASLKVPIIEMPRPYQPTPGPVQLKRPAPVASMNPSLARPAAHPPVPAVSSSAVLAKPAGPPPSPPAPPAPPGQ